MRLSFLTITTILSFLFSCEKDITDKFRDSEENLFIISGVLEANEHPTINLTRSVTMTQLDTLQYLNNAVVEIRSANQTFIMESIGYGNYSTEEVTLRPGEEYHFHCSGEELPEASATVTIPALPAISDITWTVDDSLSLHLDISIDDPVQTFDYYSFYLSGWLREIHTHRDESGEKTRDTLNVFTNYRIRNQNTLFEYTGDHRNFRAIEKGSMYVSIAHFSDRNFDGATLNLSIEDELRRFYNDSIPEININIVKRDNHYFNYIESIIRYDPYNELPIIQPVQIYSNIEGGFGLLTAKSHFTQTIDMSQWYNDPKLLELFGK